MNIFELFGSVALKGTEKVEQNLTTLEKRTQQVQKGMRVMGAAFTAVGAAGLALIQSTKKINAQLGVTAVTLGSTVKEMRALTLATTNVTFPIEEVTASFDLLARAGVRDLKVLQDTATAFDTLGDATGMSASRVTSILVPAMKTFNLTATEMASKTDLMTYMSRESTMSLDDFATMVGYTTPELVEQGLTIEELTVALIHMEKQGYAPGRVMTREFMKATTLAAKEGISLGKALGITEEQMEAYNKDLEGAAGMTEKYAAVANEQFTIMDKMKQKWSELTLGASGFLEPLEPVLAGMTAMGPLMMGLSTSAGTAAVKWGLHTTALIAHKVALFASAIAMKVAAAAQWLLNIALTANPIGLIILAIVALIAIAVLLIKNWDKVTHFFRAMWFEMKKVFNAAKEFFVGIWNSIVGIFRDNWDKILAILFPVVGIPILIARNWDKIIEFFTGIPAKIGKIFSAIKDIILAPFRAAWAGIEAGVNALINMLNKIKIKIPDWVPGIGGKEFGVDISEVALPKFAGGGLIPEPTMLYGLRSQRPYGIAGEAGVERIVPGGGAVTVTNIFQGPWFIREEADIGKIARELFRLQQTKVRAAGG